MAHPVLPRHRRHPPRLQPRARLHGCGNSAVRGSRAAVLSLRGSRAAVLSLRGSRAAVLSLRGSRA